MPRGICKNHYDYQICLSFRNGNSPITKNLVIKMGVKILNFLRVNFHRNSRTKPAKMDDRLK